MKLKPDSKEWQEAYEAMQANLKSGECVTINEAGQVSFCHRLLGQIADSGSGWTEAEAYRAIEAEMKRVQFFPNVYRINERGNAALLDYKGREIAAWV